MTTDGETDHAAPPSRVLADGEDGGEENGEAASARSRQVATPLAGFFTGTVLVLVVLGGLGVVLRELFDVELSEHPGPFLVAITSLFVLNVVLLVAPGTRRFARFMLFGLLGTPVVVGGVAAITLYVLVRTDG